MRRAAITNKTVGALALVSILAHTPAGADEQAERNKLLAHIQQVQSSPEQRTAAIAAGRERALLCAYCHGKDGNSLKPEIPNLAGQNPTYLLEQIEKFADGRRQDFVMQSLAAEFTLEDKVNLAVFYSSEAVRPDPVDPALAAKGKPIYTDVCQRCHGDDGHGEAGYARIAGQRVPYVIQALKSYRAFARGKESKRGNLLMGQVTLNLTDEQIEALAAYVGQLTPR